jgi:hypothetical protein
VGERISPKLVLFHDFSLRWIWWIWWIVWWVLWRIGRRILWWMLGNIWWNGHVMPCIKVHPVSTTALLKVLELLLGLLSDVVESLMTGTQRTKLSVQQLHVMTVATGPCLLRRRKRESGTMCPRPVSPSRLGGMHFTGRALVVAVMTLCCPRLSSREWT